MSSYTLVTKLHETTPVKLYKDGKLIKEFNTVVEAMEFADTDAGICRELNYGGVHSENCQSCKNRKE